MVLATVTVLLGGLCVWSYRDCWYAFFYLDDFVILAAADRVRIQSVLDVAQFFQPLPGSVMYRPLSTLLYFYVLLHVFGTDPRGFHAVQIGVQILNALWVYGIAAALFRSRRLGLASALVYVTAPAHALAACWIAAFSMSGTAFFYLAAIFVWLRAGHRWRQPLTLLMFGAALLASEHAISLPIVLTLASVLLAPRPSVRRIIREHAALYGVAAVYVAIKLYYLRYLVPEIFPSLPERVFIESVYGISLDPYTLVHHLGGYLGFSLTFAYRAMRPAAGAVAAGTLLIGGAVFSTACVITGRWTARALRVAVFGLALFLVALVPVVALRAVVSYYAGIAALGIALAAIGFARALPRRFTVMPAAVAVVALLTHTLSTAALVRRSEEFRIFETFSQDAAHWLCTVARHAAQSQPVEEVVVPTNLVTAYLFTLGEADRVFLRASYRVRTAQGAGDLAPAPGRIVVDRLDPEPAGASWCGDRWQQGAHPGS